MSFTLLPISRSVRSTLRSSSLLVTRHRPAPHRINNYHSSFPLFLASSPPPSTFPESIPETFDFHLPLPLSPLTTTSHIIPRSPGQRTIAFGDIHGDLPALLQALLTASLIEPLPLEGSFSTDEIRWCGGTDILVQVGDLLDRGPGECAVMSVLANLSRQALTAGGGIVLCLGNHEVLNSLGLFNYASKEGNNEFEQTFASHYDQVEDVKKGGKGDSWRLHYAGNQPARWRVLEPRPPSSSTPSESSSSFSSHLLSTFVLSCQVGSSLFVHGGLTSKHLTQHKSIANMNNQARKWLTSGGYSPKMILPASQTSEQIIADAQLRADSISKTMPEFLGGGSKTEPSPVWMREYSSPNDAPVGSKDALMLSKMLENVTKLGGECKRIVVGHTPQDQINFSAGGKVWRVDVGMSQGVMGNRVEVLEILEGDVNGEEKICILQMEVCDVGGVKAIRGKRIDAKERENGGKRS